MHISKSYVAKLPHTHAVAPYSAQVAPCSLLLRRAKMDALGT